MQMLHDENGLDILILEESSRERPMQKPETCGWPV